MIDVHENSGLNRQKKNVQRRVLVVTAVIQSLGCPELASECPEVASELVRDIFDFFGLFFQGKEIIMRKYYFGRNKE